MAVDQLGKIIPPEFSQVNKMEPKPCSIYALMC